MKNHLRAARYTVEKPAGSGFAISFICYRGLVNASRRHFAIWALLLASVAGVINSQAATLVWTTGDDFWQSTTAWTTNLTGGTGSFPGSGDDAYFTNAATYTVTLTSDVLNIQSNFFNNASNTTATVTLNLNTHELNPAYAGTSPGGFVVGDGATSTTTVYLASSTAAAKGLIVPGRVVVGRNGFGTLFVTSGNVSAGTTILANGSGGRGTLVLSGPTTVWSNISTFAIGNNSNSFGSSLVISNSAMMDVTSSFRLGSGSSSGGSSNNTLLLDSHARLFTHSGPTTIGHRSTGLPSSCNNSAIVQGGAVWDNGNATFIIGSVDNAVATGNVLTVGISGAVTNISQFIITTGNTLDLAGGVVDATITCTGTVQGFGVILGDTTIADGGLFNPFNSLGKLTFSNKLILANTATATVQLGTNQLGTNINVTVANNGLTLGGTLNITDGGGFTNGTYTVFIYNSTLTYNGLTIGTTPNNSFTYTINTNTSHMVKLVVSAPVVPPTADFSGSPVLGAAPLVVIFTDSSTGTITKRFWDFGDGITSNTSLTSLTHTYNSAGTFDVSLTAFGPSGTDTLSRTSYVTATNVPLPVITTAATVTNAALQVGNVIVVLADDTNVFNVGVMDSSGNPLSFQWSFGDGVTNVWSPSNTVEHTYTNACGPYTVNVAISNGLAVITTNFTVTVACQLNLTRVMPKLNFARTNTDSCTVLGSFSLPSGFSFTGKVATLNVGGAQLSFTLPKRGAAINGRSRLSVPTFNRRTGLWALKATFSAGSWHDEWANYSMINSNILRPGILVTNLPVIFVLGTEASMATTNLHYTATLNRSGLAR